MKKTIKSILPISINNISNKQIEESLSNLSENEINQLNQKDYPDTKTWAQIRLFFEERSLASNPLLSKNMTAYTPAETLKLMEKNTIKNWLNNIENLRVPDKSEIVIFVPCAKTKPWKNATRGIYKSYNKIIEENDEKIYFVTISEPLGIVPQNNWSDFPQYDNPGLFKDIVQRSGGLFTRDWIELFGKKYKLPWDQKAYEESIQILSEKIKLFILNNQKKGREFISFVGDENTIGTHQDMVNRTQMIPEKNQYLKRATTREEPYEHIKEKLNLILNINKNKKVKMRI